MPKQPYLRESQKLHHRVSFDLTNQERQTLNTTAQQHGVSDSAFIRQLVSEGLRKYLKEEEVA